MLDQYEIAKQQLEVARQRTKMENIANEKNKRMLIGGKWVQTPDLQALYEAKKELSIDSYKNEMNGIYSTSVCKETIDEAPMAYKPTEEIVELIKPTVDVIDVLKPIYNFKAKS